MSEQENHSETEARNRQYYLDSNPGLTHSTASFNYATFEKGIGITNIPVNRTEAYWPLSFADYCVEEHLTNGMVASVDKRQPQPEASGNFILLQVISSAGTAAILHWLKQALSLEQSEIGFASSKDGGFISSQFFSLPSAKESALESLPLPSNVILSGYAYGESPLAAAALKGHTYTMLLRTKDSLETDALVIKVDMLAKYGVLNFFPAKRFGRRHLAHLFGKLLLQEDFETAVKDFLCQTSPTEELLLTRLREVAASAFPNTEKLEKIFGALPVTFSNELAMVRYLGAHPSDFAGAILEVKHLARQWLFSYGAYAFNSHLSDVSADKGVTDERFPWAFSPDSADKAIYREYFQRDNIYNGFEVDYIKALIPTGKQLLPGRIFPKDIACRATDRTVALSFFLEGNLPAETVMANLFNITNVTPVPEWVDNAPVDPKQVLGHGSLSELASKLHPHA